MGNFNKVLLLGNLTRDPEVKYSANGNAFAQFGIATNRNWTDRETGEKQEETCFVDAKAFGRTAEIAGEYLQKGSPVFIEGRLSQYSWEDEQGLKRSKHSVVIESLQLLPRLRQAVSDEEMPVEDGKGHEQLPDEPADDIPF